MSSSNQLLGYLQMVTQARRICGKVIVSLKSGDTMDYARSSSAYASASAEIFLCSTYKSHFLRVKNIKNFDL